MDTINGFYKVRQVRDFRDMVDQSATLFRESPAFKMKEPDGSVATVTFEEYQTDIRALGSALWERGFSGKKIAVMGANSYEWGLSYLAVTCGLGVIVPIDKELPIEDVKNILEVSGAELLIVDKRSLKKLSPGLKDLPAGLQYAVMGEPEDKDGMLSFRKLVEEGHVLVEQRSQAFIMYMSAPIDPDAMSVLIFTSGTSGKAKGVMLSQHNICFDIESVSSVVDIHPGDQMLAVLPLHHTFECSLGFLAPLYNGACNAFSRSIFELPKDLKRYQPTVFFTVPLMMEKLHDRIIRTVEKTKGGKFKLQMGKALVSFTDKFGIQISEKVFKKVIEAFGGHLRLIIVGAAAVRPDVVKDFRKFGINTYIGYGLTECAPLVTGNNDELMTNDSVGVPIPGVEIKIENPNEEGIGEVLVRGPNVMLGYYEDEEQTREVLSEDGWFRTGDYGYLDKKNLLRLTGRAKNVIVTKNGKNIYPEEIEDQLNRHPFIAESMVVGKDEDEKTGTVVEAKILPDMEAIKEAFKDKHEPTTDEIMTRVREAVKDINRKLPSYKAIKEFTIRQTDFIKTTTAKIKRFANMDDKPADTAAKPADTAEKPADTAEKPAAPDAAANETQGEDKQ